MDKKEKTSNVTVKKDFFIKYVDRITPAVLADIISQAEAAKLRGCARASINELVKNGRLRVALVGGRPFVLRSEVENFKDRRRVDTA
jgi:predicted XRE-type DNA-binding protein